MRHESRPLALRVFLRVAAILGISLACLVLATFALQIYENNRFAFASTPGALGIAAPEALARFTVSSDPYAPEGCYYRVQLHTHTTRSDGGLTPVEVAASYRRDGYDAVFLTDHDRITRTDGLSDARFLTLPGKEQTMLRPLGRHLLHLGLDTHTGKDGLLVPTHPSSPDSLGACRWYAHELLRYDFLTIACPDSDLERDLQLWHYLLVKRGPARPVWGTADEDAHHGSKGWAWVWVKAERLEAGSILGALRRGSFYATRGPRAEFGVRGGEIVVKAESADWVRFIDQQQRVVAAIRGCKAAYKPHGDEGFIRVEVESGGLTAYSQPFWLAAAAKDTNP